MNEGVSQRVTGTVPLTQERRVCHRNRPRDTPEYTLFILLIKQT